MASSNCWDNRTTLETVLILILIVSVPFLIGMIVFYVIMPRYDDFVHCPTFCKQFTFHVIQKFGKRRVDTDDLPNNNPISEPNAGTALSNHHKEDEMCDSGSCENMYSFLIALLNYKYDDDLSEQIFLGTGVLVTNKWALTTSTIVNKYTFDRYRIQVRAGSGYWSKGGIVSDVDRVVLAEDSKKETIAALSLTASFSNEISPIKISSHKFYTNNVVYPTYGWNANYSLALRLRKKHISSIKVYVTAFDNDICPEITEGKKFCARPLYSTVYQPCLYERGFAMVDRHNILLGIKSGEICSKNQSVHVYHNVFLYVDWIRNITTAQIRHW